MSTLLTFSRLSATRSLLGLTAALCMFCNSTAQAVQAAGPTGLLNDTGQTQCYNASDLAGVCDAATTGDAGVRPRQDGRFGRDVASPTKVGGGAAGFDFTPLDASGNVIALTGSPAVPATTPRCVKDNVTNLIWEVKTTATPASGLQDKTWTYAWGSNAGAATCGGTVGPCNTDAYIAALNLVDLCGETANDWRLPTRRELLGIVLNDGSNPSIDASYLPATQSSWYWSSDTYAPNPSNAWLVGFSNGNTLTYAKTVTYFVRLVRSGQ